MNQIFRCGQTSGQVIVLSHEPHFLELICKRIESRYRKTLMMARVGEDSTTIVEWDVERAVESPYRVDLDTLQRFSADGEGEARDIVQKIRPVLESYYRHAYPTQFSRTDLIGDIIAKIRAAGNVHPLSDILADLEDLNEYSSQYHHGENGNPIRQHLDGAELQGYVKRTLKLVGCLF